jgi:DNA repair exonuclease SbcCD ATPase subunit
MKTPENNNDDKKVDLKQTEAKKKSSFFSEYREVILTVIIIGVVGLAAYFLIQQSNEKEVYAAIEMQNQDLEQQLITRDSLINEWVVLFDQVEADLKTIREKESMLAMSSNDMELTQDKREAILADIQMLNTLLEQNKRKVESLNKRLKNSGAKIASLEKKLEELNVALESRNQEIDTLKMYLVERDFQLADLNIKLSDIETEMGQQRAIIEGQESELRKAYIAFGTHKQLEEKGLVTRRGGFLGMGKTKTLNTDFPQDEFTVIDISSTTTIPVNAKEVELITEHPSGSYKLVPSDSEDLVAYIAIENPEEFWKITRYAIVETGK